jgi:hypothetical protein
MAPLFSRIRCLTGRPMTQGPHDLWAQLTVLGLYDRNYYGFRNTFCRMGGWGGKQVIGSQNEELLQQIMAPGTVVATKAEWMPSLPAKSYTERDYALGPILGPRYREMERDFLVWLAAHQAVSVDVVIAQYQKLLQIQCGFVHKGDGSVEWLVEDKDNPRLALLREMIDLEVNGKVAVCYSHRAVGWQLEREYPNAAHIKGDMRPDALDQQKDKFNLNPTCRMILLQVDAGRYGHTLLGDPTSPAHRCSTMLFYQSSYSFDTRSQLEDRIHRTGQHDACTYVDFVGTGMDRHILHAIRHKRNVYEAVMGR